MNQSVKTYRGRSLDEVLPQIKAELGPEALVLAQRETSEGGVGGFFAKRLIEVDAQAPAAGIDTRVGDEEQESHDDKLARFAEQLEAALPAPAPVMKPHVTQDVPAFPEFEIEPLATRFPAYT